MIKPELVDKITMKHGRLERKIVEIAVNVILEQMATALENGERIEVRGFGSFDIRLMKGGMRRNPKTKETFTSKAKHKVHFKPGKDLKDRVNENS